MSVVVNGNAAQVRLNSDTAIQLTSPGNSMFRAGSPIWIGGGNNQDAIIIRSVTGQKSGFYGMFHDIILNGQPMNMKGKAILNKKGFANSMGISLAGTSAYWI